ncbi:MAG TPA: hypothetical protein VGK53_02170 [Propionicimonas sp.]|jgi:hypothetical protein
MGINESDIERYLSGSMTKDDPAWGEVSAFLESLDSAYPVESVAAFEDRHVPALGREARLIAGGQDLGKRRTMKDIFAFKTHRALIATIAAALLALSAGVGVASAMGVNPLAHLAPASDPVVTPVPTAPTESAAPTPEPTDDDQADEPGDDQGDAEADDDNSTETPKAAPTKTHESDEADDDSEEADDQGDDDSDDSSEAGDDQSDHGEQAGDDDEHGDNSGDAGDDHGDDEPGDD